MSTSSLPHEHGARCRYQAATENRDVSKGPRSRPPFRKLFFGDVDGPKTSWKSSSLGSQVTGMVGPDSTRDSEPLASIQESSLPMAATEISPERLWASSSPMATGGRSTPVGGPANMAVVTALLQEGRVY